jgi:transcription-repair coupling factor (superfamily II helicase)
MKGEPQPVVGEIRLDVPTDANLPHDYIANETARLEAYRRLAAVTTPAEVDDIAAEWVDRYGPIPPLAEALLDVARLRAECHRLGLTEVTISTRSFGPGEARLGPLELKLSEATRLRRLARQAKYKEEQRQLVVPLPTSGRGGAQGSRQEPASFLVNFLRELIPVGSPP